MVYILAIDKRESPKTLINKTKAAHYIGNVIRSSLSCCVSISAPLYSLRLTLFISQYRINEEKMSNICLWVCACVVCICVMCPGISNVLWLYMCVPRTVHNKRKRHRETNRHRMRELCASGSKKKNCTTYVQKTECACYTRKWYGICRLTFHVSVLREPLFE